MWEDFSYSGDKQLYPPLKAPPVSQQQHWLWRRLVHRAGTTVCPSLWSAVYHTHPPHPARPSRRRPAVWSHRSVGADNTRGAVRWAPSCVWCRCGASWGCPPPTTWTPVWSPHPDRSPAQNRRRVHTRHSRWLMICHWMSWKEKSNANVMNLTFLN